MCEPPDKAVPYTEDFYKHDVTVRKNAEGINQYKVIQGGVEWMDNGIKPAFRLIPEPQVFMEAGGRGLEIQGQKGKSSIEIAKKLIKAKDGIVNEFGFVLSYCSIDKFSEIGSIKCSPGFDFSEGYFLSIGPEGVWVGADTEKARFYAVQTVAQIIVGTRGEDIPALVIEDWPDLKMRCFNVCYHTAVANMPSLTPNFETLLDLVELYSHLKMNALLFEAEGLFPYEKYPALSNAYAFSRQQVELLRDTCRRRHVEIIPLVQSLGHAYQVLRHAEFAHLRELPDTSQQYCPCNDEVPAFYNSMVEEVIDALGPIRYFHLGGDESRRLGKCPKCEKKLAEHGMGALYGDHMNRVAGHLVRKGIKPLIWADIAEEHPDILAVLDGNIGLVFWNYDMVDWRPYAMEQFAESSRMVIGACAAKFGAHSEYLFLYKKAMRNISLMASECRRNRLEGMMVTDWVKLAPNEVGIIANCFGAHVAWSFHNDQKEFGRSFSSLLFGLETEGMDEVFKLLSEISLRKKDVLNNFWAAPYSDLNEGFMADWLDRFDWSGRDFNILMRKYTNQESLPQVFAQLEKARTNAEKAIAVLDGLSGNVLYKKDVFDVIALAGKMQHFKCSVGIALSKAVRLLKFPVPGDSTERMAAAGELDAVADCWRLLREDAYKVLIKGTFKENLDICIDFKFDPDILKFLTGYSDILKSGKQLQGLFDFSLYPDRTGVADE